MESLIEQVAILSKIVYNLQEQVQELTLTKKEIYYQKLLEKLLGASHQVVKYGTTDITTSTQHIEIKQWKLYKNAIGQLISYNYGDTKKLIVVFFGECKNNKEKIIELFTSKNIQVWEFTESDNIYKYNNLKKDDDNLEDGVVFNKWLDKNIFKTNCCTDYIELKSICELFLGTKKIHSRVLGKYKAQIKKYIKEKYPSISYEYKQHYINNSRPRGWINLKLV